MQAVFTQGSIMRHILVMTLSSTVGLLSLFLVDLVDMYFLSLLGQQELAAAVGFAGTLLFFLTAISIALSIGMGAKVSQSLGQQRLEKARQYCVHTLIFSFLFSLAVVIPVWLESDTLLRFLGADGRTLELAIVYTHILLPSTPILAMSMGLASALRAAGDPRRSMYAIAAGGVANAILDPILIFGLDMDIAGAAWSSFIARFVILGIAGTYVIMRHGLITSPNWSEWWTDIRSLATVSGPAMLTNLATPVGSSYVMKTMAEFGDDAVAGAAIIGRIVPVAFCGLFALSGAVGPIIGQNMGAGDYYRVRHTLGDASKFIAGYVMVVWAILFFLSDFIISSFDASGDARHLINQYCLWIAPGFFFNGLLFVANASFNNTNSAYLATLFNFSRAFLGTIPFVALLSNQFGAVGVLIGEIAGGVMFGTLAMGTAVYRANHLTRSMVEKEAPDTVKETNACQWSYCSDKSALGQQVVESGENS
ncbi:MATE family efflux transporter [Hahella sp. CCB-MM4]|uniref:MATE family efflux transporter n=1 Tax=Hahella sp. (strain CCB-MM4) TaxID=1926491 RepID=UPI000B9BDB43|nr:MATE family efflux transporter [Hahella sp. CCB-MM4]OZG75168.1 MATE family efflux transporter [Hahella sp. CCB-MM4]